MQRFHLYFAWTGGLLARATLSPSKLFHEVYKSARRIGFLLLTALLGSFSSEALSVDHITGAVNAVVNSGGTRAPTSIANTWNQAGLSSPYVSDVTPFQPYVATTTHSFLFVCCEWFSSENTTSASVTYDLGELDQINGVALWNEEVSGIGTLNLFYSTDNITFFIWNSAPLKPVDRPFNSDYPAEVFNLPLVTLRYVRFDMSDCPQMPSGFPSCSIGEVAFRDPESAPEPGLLTLLGIGLAGLALSRRRS